MKGFSIWPVFIGGRSGEPPLSHGRTNILYNVKTNSHIENRFCPQQGHHRTLPATGRATEPANLAPKSTMAGVGGRSAALFSTAAIKAKLGIWIGTAALAVTCAAAAFDGRLSWAMTDEGLDVSWTSPSLTEQAPFVHYEFQVQQSVDLIGWEASGALVPGGFINSPSEIHTVRLPTTDARSFLRLNYHLNMPGADLSGFDLQRCQPDWCELDRREPRRHRSLGINPRRRAFGRHRLDRGRIWMERRFSGLLCRM